MRRDRGCSVDQYNLSIDGEFVDAASGETSESIDPGTGMPIAQVAKAGTADAEAVVDAEKCFGCGVCVIGCKESHSITMKCVRPVEHIPVMA